MPAGRGCQAGDAVQAYAVGHSVNVYDNITYLEPDRRTGGRARAASGEEVGRGDLGRIVRRFVNVQRLAAGNFGDCKSITEGLWEMRIDQGPGYRV